MRVISGACRGKKLFAPTGDTTRPTSDRVKEALFSILSSRMDFADIRVLDICAGTGSLGIEALSRGSKSCCYIESNQSVISILTKNLTVTRCLDRSVIMNMDVVKALPLLAGRGQNFDLVFFDPPYNSELYTRVPEVLISGRLLAPHSILVIERSARNPLPEDCRQLKCFASRVYGETALELFELEDE